MLSHLKRRWLRSKLKHPDYDFLLQPPLDEDWVVFDCETTGLNPKKDSLVSLSAIKIRGQQILTSESLNVRFRPQTPVSPESIVIHRLRNVDLDEGVTEAQGIEQFVRFVGSRPLVGYFLEFDMAMVNRVIYPWLGIKLPNPQLDISEYYRELYYKAWLQPEHEVFDLSFQAMLTKCQIPALAEHDAFNDALMTAMLFVKMRTLLQQKEK